MRRRILALVALLVLALFGSGAVAAEPLRPGHPAAGFALEALTGGPLPLMDALGERATLVVFWAAWSPRSTEALSDFESLYRQYGPETLQVIGVNVEHEEVDATEGKQLAQSAAELGITFPLAIDRGLSAYRSCEFTSVPSFLVLDGAGRVVETMAGYPSTLRSAFRGKLLRTMGVATAEDGTPREPVLGYVPKGDAGTYFQMGKLLFRKGKHDKGLRLMMRAVAEDPDYLEAGQFLAATLISLGRVEEARRLEVHVAALNGDT